MRANERFAQRPGMPDEVGLYFMIITLKVSIGELRFVGSVIFVYSYY